MNTKYQLVLIGKIPHFLNSIVETFKARVKDLGLSDTSISIIDGGNFRNEYKSYSPTACIYFGGDGPSKNVDILETVVADACYVIPSVPSLDNYSNLVPKSLEGINGFPLPNETKIEALVARVMECLSLLRVSRRLFISYRRVESRSVAIQLYEYLDQVGFDVFLDTHSINAGDVFQEELWHRLVDTDVVVLLDTPGFLESRWTEQELAKASSMSIGILQLIWPGHTQIPYSKLSFPFNLDEADFIDRDFSSSSASLREEVLDHIGSKVESIRARSLASRQDNLIQEFTATSKKLKKTASLQPEKFIVLKKKDGNDVAFIPTIGVPNGFTYNQTQELIKEIKEDAFSEIYLLYDHRNIRDKWLAHLQWLDLFLPVKTMKITEIHSQLQRF